ncbi:trifunctional serine/threonine-protein kinase/ATP-binding protein/sensor histidine kinase [Cupriavidus pauculus]|uniref:histidine kinase n=1 Tax=Cupriavidus pauculus TaxID=82633 RepID=A0A2N5CB66_9BURK|nr:trifunctional serine/threonine-protein kinase/ATP-binding protein/sensor histidine kinase [Cupriavidus pauculus]PLP99468.1 protein kinase [Cupriavidus pauculus]
MGDSRSLQVLWEDAERVFCRARRPYEGGVDDVLMVRPGTGHLSSASFDRITHEFRLKDELDSTWAVLPKRLLQEDGRPLMLLEDPGGEPLERLLGAPMEVGSVLHFAAGVAAALGQLHQRGLVHKDVKPAHILVNCTDGRTRLTGFGIASRLPREHQRLDAPETIAGTLAYMAPEQTGRMNRTIDSRSDLYSFGVVLYKMLTGTLPFSATDPMEWVHCHIARKPVPPSERMSAIPEPLSDLVMKLLAKTGEERYQTAAGVEHDLQHCLDCWARDGWIDAFALGECDTPDRLVIPEKLYGREREVNALVAAFERVVTTGVPELVLVSGYSGIGKSSVVNELHKALVPPRGIFAAGKFDQYKRDIPYSTLVQAFQNLVRPLLGKRESELVQWRDALLEAMGPNARLMTDLIPELKLITGERPPVPELEPQQAQSRFQLVFRRFIGVFATSEHPLALFLDDLQWLDTATLDLLEDLLIRSELRHLMVIGAYRDNEVDAAHPLTRKLLAIKSAGGQVEEIALGRLSRDHLGELIADAVRCEPKRVLPLAQLVHEKTAGNPFFAIQFLCSLAAEELLFFDHDATCWSWDLDRIHAKGYTDNVVDLMVGKLNRLPVETQAALQHLACLGNMAEFGILATVLAVPEKQVHVALWAAVHQELVERSEGAYRFIHDRVQEAAYSLIPLAMRAQVHLRIGRLLRAQAPASRQEEAIFETVSQLNRGASLITLQEERDQLAELNLIAGKRAGRSSAYAAALNYLNIGVALLAEDSWERQHELTFALELSRAECEFLTGQLSVAEERLSALSKRASTNVERATVACLHMDVCLVLDQSSRAITVGLSCLRDFGIEWSPHPDDEAVQREYAHIWTVLDARVVEDLIDSPLMEDPASLATVDVLMKIWTPALYTDENLASLTICKAVSLSLEHGNCDASTFAYVILIRIAGPRFGDYQAGFRFGQLGFELVERRGLKRLEARTFVCFALFVVPWMKHVRACRELQRRAFDAANRVGDLQYATYTRNDLNSNLIFAGEPLSEAQDEAEHGLAFATKSRFGLAIDIIATQVALIRTLRGLTSRFGCFDDEQFDEEKIERRFLANPELAIAACWYWIRKLQARCIAGDHTAALDAASKARALLWTTASFFEEAEYYFYCALSHAACCHSLSANDRAQHLEALATHHRQLEVWADNCPENFECRAALVGAEIARIEGRNFDAMQRYEQAIRSARDNGFLHIEALANERAAQFHTEHEFHAIAEMYLRNARYCYLRWQADGKVHQLEQLYPQLVAQVSVPDPMGTMATSVEHLDLSTVIKVSQAISGDIVLDKLIEMVMRTAIEQTGAQRGLLILPKAGEQRLVAHAMTNDEDIVVHLRDEPVGASLLPESVLYYVMRTRESVILDDVAADPAFSSDAYILQHRARSILCLPLMSQTKLTGVLYLENSLTAGVFTPARITVLRLVASQAAIALENGQLYSELVEREAKIRRLVDANIIGIIIWNVAGQILEANDAFLQMVGYERDDLIAGRVGWKDLTPREWQAGDERALQEIGKTARVEPYEKELVRKDGSRVPVMVGAATFEVSRMEGVAFFLDLTERRQAEEKIRESEGRFREVQTELAHANRVATMGQLTASIAHEVTQPISATVTNAQAALRWLSAQPPDLEEASQVLSRIVKDGNRAVAVIRGIRELVKKAPPRKEPLDINMAIHDVIELTRGEARKHRVSMQLLLTDGLPLVQGDRVQLQQVLLNLLINAMEAMSGVSDGVRELLISTRRADAGCVLVSVCDSGMGFSAQDAERLFAPFFTNKSSGLGMGLSICRSIIEAHGGRLWASENVPRGAIFQFTVPDCSDVSP